MEINLTDFLARRKKIPFADIHWINKAAFDDSRKITDNDAVYFITNLVRKFSYANRLITQSFLKPCNCFVRSLINRNCFFFIEHEPYVCFRDNKSYDFNFFFENEKVVHRLNESTSLINNMIVDQLPEFIVPIVFIKKQTPLSYIFDIYRPYFLDPRITKDMLENKRIPFFILDIDPNICYSVILKHTHNILLTLNTPLSLNSEDNNLLSLNFDFDHDFEASLDEDFLKLSTRNQTLVIKHPMLYKGTYWVYDFSKLVKIHDGFNFKTSNVEIGSIYG